MSTDGLRVLTLKHNRQTSGGLVQDWLEGQTGRVDVLSIDIEGLPQSGLTEYDLVVSFGSGSSAYDDLPWIGRELSILAEADRRQIPVLGICFGSQLLARALGGKVFRAASSEIGWFSVGSCEPGLIAEGPWFQWHFDTFTTPHGAVTLASNAVGPQAYRIGPHLGLQFHPEVTLEIMEEWVVIYRDELNDSGIDHDLLLEETRKAIPMASANTARLLERFVGEIGEPHPRGSESRTREFQAGSRPKRPGE